MIIVNKNDYKFFKPNILLLRNIILHIAKLYNLNHFDVEEIFQRCLLKYIEQPDKVYYLKFLVMSSLKEHLASMKYKTEQPSTDSIPDFYELELPLPNCPSQQKSLRGYVVQLENGAKFRLDKYDAMNLWKLSEHSLSNYNGRGDRKTKFIFFENQVFFNMEEAKKKLKKGYKFIKENALIIEGKLIKL